MSAGLPAATVEEALAGARALGVDRLDARLLLAHCTGRPGTWLLAHGEHALAPAEAAAHAGLCRRRAAGEPLAYLVGEREFHGLSLAVAPGVLVPRPDTETLVDWALDLLDGELRARPAPRVLDLGTGSGAIALALRHDCPRADVWAVERSPEALAVARANVRRLGLAVRLEAGHWWSALPADAPAFDLVVSNPPYIAAGDPHLEALAHEPREALVAGEDGLADIAQILEGAGSRLAPGGWLLFEHGWTQAGAVAQRLRAAGFEAVTTRSDLAGRARCTGARHPGRPGRPDAGDGAAPPSGA